MENKLRKWIWRWHTIGGLIALPFVIVLTISGIIYLFKNDYQEVHQKQLEKAIYEGERLSFQEQWEICKRQWSKKASVIVVPSAEQEATEFTAGRFSHKSSFFVNPYGGAVLAKVNVNETDMFKVRKLHGELLMGSFGTKIVELIASWMIILIISGVYLYWPRGGKWNEFFRLRKKPRRMLYRDLHALTGFLSSILLLLILAGGLPWTDFFGNNFKWIQKVSDTGYPKTWNNRAFQSTVKGDALSLDEMIKVAQTLDLEGVLSIQLPQQTTSVFSVSNENVDISSKSIHHFDQYSGELLHSHTGNDIGFMMKTRLWLMAFHQGEFGWWNWALVLLTAIGLLGISLTAIFSYALRKRKGSWCIPTHPTDFNVSSLLLLLLILLGILLPMFGVSLVVLVAFDKLRTRLF